ncbi:hypothetical protein [Tetragenococcus halophilus]|uniref:hypothetical protein n=1 Tax=Tetragenococcus halophilus TaxID=51669 RepID=UPI001B3D0062|nr:hypothetical protein [Tetragenococcus halophilus]GFK24883.1 hypothetical protein YA163_19460 [Tetragenococcus halophilus]
MAINNIINLDDQLSRTKSVQLAGKTYEVKISDETDKAFAKLTSVDLPGMLDELESKADLLDENNEEPDYNEYYEFIETSLGKVRDKVLAALDEILGQEGAGQEIYEYYNKSTKTLVIVVDLLQEALDSVMEERNEKAQKKYQNKNIKGKSKAKK